MNRKEMRILSFESLVQVIYGQIELTLYNISRLEPTGILFFLLLYLF